MSDYTKSSSRQTQAHKLPIAKSAIRPRPTGALGSYQLCWQFERRQTCSRGQKCTFAHGENERIAWEEDRKKGILKNKTFTFLSTSDFLHSRGKYMVDLTA